MMRRIVFAAMLLLPTAAPGAPPIQTAIDPADLFIIIPRGDSTAQSHYIRPTTMADYFLSQTSSLGLPSFVGPGLNPSLFPSGSRGPLFIWNNPSSSLVGQAAGEQIWIGSNPTATPGVNDSVALSIGIDNLGGRTATWAINVVCGQLAVGSGGGAGIGHCVELNPYAGQAVDAPTNPFTTGASVQGLEITPTAGGTVSVQDAIKIFGSSQTATDWPNFGVALARINHAGFVGQDYPGDGVTGFDTAMFWDKSSSNAVLKADGTHNRIIDLTGMTTLASPFVQTPNSFDASLLFSNEADHDNGIAIDSGSTGTHGSFISFSDRATTKWQLIKNNGNEFFLIDSVSGHGLIRAQATDDLLLGDGGILSLHSGGGGQIGAPTGGDKGAGTLNAAGGVYNNGGLVFSPTAPTIASGGCTTGSAQSISAANGTAAFEITLGGATCGSTITLTMPAAAHNWVCDAHDVTTPATNAIDMTGAPSTTVVVLTNFVRTTGVAGNFIGADKLAVKCSAY